MFNIGDEPVPLMNQNVHTKPESNDSVYNDEKQKAVDQKKIKLAKIHENSNMLAKELIEGLTLDEQMEFLENLAKNIKDFYTIQAEKANANAEECRDNLNKFMKFIGQ